MVKSKLSVELGRKSGSSVCESPAVIPLTPGRNGCGNVPEATGNGAVMPSVPMRNTFSGLTGSGAPVAVNWQFGFPATAEEQLTACKMPGPSNGTSTWLTPFKRPKTLPYPPRITVLPCPKICARNPDLKVGFQATETLGLKPFLKGVYGYFMC